MATARPVRSMDPYAAQFWAYTQKKELRLQKCSDCGKFRWPPGPTCDKCLSDNAEWAAVAGRGKVLSWTTFRRKYFDEYPAPHTAIVLELDEGPLFVSYPVGVDASDCARAWCSRCAGRMVRTSSANTTCRCLGLPLQGSGFPSGPIEAAKPAPTAASDDRHA